MNIILDLDETLLHSTYELKDSSPDCTYRGRYVYFRPNVIEFIVELNKIASISIWSSAKADYAKFCLKKLFSDLALFESIKTRKDCKRKQVWNGFSNETYYIKDLSNYKNSWIIDDRPECIEPISRCIPISRFMGNMEDNELLLILEEVKMILN